MMMKILIRCGMVNLISARQKWSIQFSTEINPSFKNQSDSDYSFVLLSTSNKI